MKSKKLIIGNWKMAPVKAAEAKKTFEKIKMAASSLRKTETVVCPPSVFLSELGKISSPKCAVGAQDAFWEMEGARTGEVSPLMLRDAKAKYVIVGHSERRALGETDEMAAKKVAAIMGPGLTPVLCIGEKNRDAEGEYYKFLEAQIAASLKGVMKTEISKVVLAYEPVWAIGAKATGAITSSALFETVIFIRKVLSKLYDKETAFSITILYGGSVDENNSGAFLAEQGVGGLLVGRSSLDAEKFVKILKIAEGL